MMGRKHRVIQIADGTRVRGDNDGIARGCTVYRCCFCNYVEKKKYGKKNRYA